MITSSVVLGTQRTPQGQLQDALARVAHLEAALARVTAERDKLRRAYEQLKEQVELLRRRIYIAKAERVDVTQLEMEFAETQAKLDALAKQLDDQAAPPAATDSASNPADPPPSAKTRSKPTGRRNLADEDLPEERVEILDPALEGEAERLGFEKSFKLRYRRGGHVRVVVARATYKTESPADPGRPDAKPFVELVTAPMPKELFPRGLLAPSMIAHILVQKYRWGLPFHRQARMSAAEGFRLDDGMMCRYAEDAGATLGCIVEAMAKEAKDTAFCLSTDATGVCIQPEPLAGRKHQACRKGHFFVVLADQDHVFFEFQPRHTSAAVCEMFRGFSGYIQADAHAIYDAVFRGEARASGDDEPPLEVGCWAHYPEPVVIQRNRRGARRNRVGDGATLWIAAGVLQRREEPKQFGLRAPGRLVAPSESGPLPERVEHVALHLEVAGDVATRGRDAGVPEVVADDRDVDARLEQRHGAAVSKDVGTDAAAAQHWMSVGGTTGVGLEQVSDAVA